MIRKLEGSNIRNYMNDVQCCRALLKHTRRERNLFRVHEKEMAYNHVYRMRLVMVLELVKEVAIH